MKIVSLEKKIVDKVVDECRENIDGNEMVYNKYGNVLNSCTMYTVFLVIFLTISISISSVFIYCYWYLKKY